MLRCLLFLWTSPPGVSTIYDLGASDVATTLPGIAPLSDVIHTSVLGSIGVKGFAR